MIYAHTTHPRYPDDSTRWEPLYTGPCELGCDACHRLDPAHGHLNKVAWWTGQLAAEMFPPESDEAAAARQWGYLAGLWHDLGKFSSEFQERLRGERERVDHSTAGAQHAFKTLPEIGQLFSYLIAGHHAGLADWHRNASGADLYPRLLCNGIPSWKSVTPLDILCEPRLRPQPALDPKDNHGIAFFTRLLFSCLVDADYIATEAFMNPPQHRRRAKWPDDILEEMLTALDAHHATFGAAKTNINRGRKSICLQCQAAATLAPGFFTLTVPTGGGKTLSSLAFAIRHAIEHGLRRVIYVIPYTSIIEQNAKVFRNAFKDLAAQLPSTLRASLVLEHHSNFESEEEGRNEKPLWQTSAENWDAPLVVTTSVQFFESLYAAKTSRCRKLHNLARSVIILDEAQNLPVNLLAPCLESLRQVKEIAGSSVVICTATQPAVGKRSEAGDPFNRIALDLRAEREIIQDVPALFRAFQRVSIIHESESLDDEGLVERIRQHERVLCILNTKGHAAKLFESLGSDDPANLHLSAQLCPAHRLTLLEEIRRRESDKEACRLVATTVIEAGVDLDFPVVFRAITGLDSLAQAGGRCNRHGVLTDERGSPIPGKVFLFTPADEKVPTFLTLNVNSTEQVLPDHKDLLSPAAIEDYFKMHYWLSGGQDGRDWDKENIVDCFQIDSSEPRHPFGFDFRTAARAFHLIPEIQAPVIIEPVRGLWPGQDEKKACETRGLLDSIRKSDRLGNPPPRGAFRRLQRYTVQIPKKIHYELVRSGKIQLYHERFPLLVHPQNDYNPKLGLMIDDHQAKIAAFYV